MADKVVSVPGVGNVSFPDSMSDEDISTAITRSQPTPGFGEQVHDLAAHTWGAATGLFTAASHPLDTVEGMFRDTADEIKQGKDAYASGKTEEAIDHFKNAIPVVGPMIRQLNNEWNGGQYGAMAGDLLGAYLGAKAPGAIPKVARFVAEAAPKIASVATAAAKAGGPDVAMGAAKTAAGVGVTQIPGANELATGIAGGPLISGGLRQMGRGLKAGYEAGKESLKPTLGPAPATPAELQMQRLFDATTPEEQAHTTQRIAPAGPVATPTPAAMSPEDIQAEQIRSDVGGQPQPPTMNEAMQQMSPAQRAEVAAANYRAIKEGAPAAEAAPVYKSAAQTTKVETVAKALSDAGITRDSLSSFTPGELRSHLGDIVKLLEINKSGEFSDESVSRLMDRLGELDHAKKFPTDEVQ